jgi:pimeloyl-ACP methyl ester carboxylesterase
VTATPTIDRFDVTVGPFTFQARAAGPEDGRPVVLLHGVPQTSICWSFQMEALAAAGHRAVAFTQRGYSPGARIDDVSAFTMDKLALDVLGVADELGIGTFDVVGHDAGAGVAWTLAGHHADRIETMTSASIPHPAAFADAYQSSKGEGGQHERSGYMREINTRPRGEMEAIFASPETMRMLYAELPPAHVDEYVELLGSPEAMRGVLDWYRAGAPARQEGTPRGMDSAFPTWRSRRCWCGPTRTRRSAPKVPTPPRSTSPLRVRRARRHQPLDPRDRSRPLQRGAARSSRRPPTPVVTSAGAF